VARGFQNEYDRENAEVMPGILYVKNEIDFLHMIVWTGLFG
jgi:hypothetical protein